MKRCPSCQRGTLLFKPVCHPQSHQIDEESSYYECSNPNCGEEYSWTELHEMVGAK
jgi:hypothetical protein